MSSIKSWFVESNTGRMRALWRILLGYLLMFAVIAVLLVTVDAIEIPWIESFLWLLFIQVNATALTAPGARRAWDVTI